MEEDDLKQLFDHEQVWWTYGENPNGSLSDIAGVANAKKNVCGLMPHPERAIFNWMGSEDGRKIFSALL
jgi:phosphoribosylformylglycinamidine synthase